MNFIGMASLALALIGCARPDQAAVGKVQDCDNGTYFSLKTQSCEALWGYSPEVDALGFDRIRIVNGVTVPRKINGYSPFQVSVAYDLARRATLEIVLKKVLKGEVSGDGLSDWRKIELGPGRGVQDLVLTPAMALPKGPAAAYIDGRWAVDSGYMLEVKGGDRFEDEDADRLASWRVAGIQIDPEAPSDPLGKDLILGSLAAPERIEGCQQVAVSLEITRLNFNASFDLALKTPGSNWDSYGGETLRVEKGFQGRLDFSFEAKRDGACAPPGDGAYADASGQYPAKAYLFQLDIYTDEGQKLDQSSEAYTIPEGSLPVIVTAGVL
jgi:hypothetical protein